MSDFVSDFWSVYVTVVTVVSIVACGVLLKMNSIRPSSTAAELHGHTWDEDLQEYNNPLPRWWVWLFYITIVFSLGYLALYPGLGSFVGQWGWSSAKQYKDEMSQADARYAPLYAKYQQQDVKAVATDPEARKTGERLFLTYCAQCHGSDARGAKGFPNLTDNDWLWGGTPEDIKESIAKGREVAMPAKGVKPDLDAEQIKDLANFVRSLSGLAADSLRVQRGKELFAVACAACHGPEGRGNPKLAPNLADATWLYSSSEADIIETITKGRMNRMPAFGEFLGDAKVHLLTAYIYGLSSVSGK